MTLAATIFEPVLLFLSGPNAELWPGGPTVRLKSGGAIPLDDYLQALTALEDAYAGVTPGELYQRLRRLYYSGPIGGAGRLFDLALSINEFCEDDFDRPVVATSSISAPLALGMLNLLFATDAVTTPSGAALDPSHWYAPLDLKFNGLGAGAELFTILGQIAWSGIFTWVGDLSSWWVEWNLRRSGIERSGVRLTAAERVQLLDDSFANRVSKEDLLGDMDAQIIAKHFSGSGRLSTLLRDYYAAEANPSGNLNAPTPNGLNRFHYFVDAAVPPLPFRIQTAVPFRVTLEPDARELIKYELIRGINLLAGHDIQKLPDPGLDIVDEITNRILQFLKTGLSGQNVNWPNP